MRTHAFSALGAALALSDCALAPEFKTLYLSQQDWRGVALTGHGRLTVADAIAGAAPRTVTLLQIGALTNLADDPGHRALVQDERAASLISALEACGVGPADIGIVAAAADGSEASHRGRCSPNEWSSSFTIEEIIT